MSRDDETWLPVDFDTRAMSLRDALEVQSRGEGFIVWPQGRAYPRRDGQSLTGCPRARFVLALWRRRCLTVRRFQAAAEIAVDGKVGPQTWVAFWAARRP